MKLGKKNTQLFGRGTEEEEEEDDWEGGGGDEGKGPE